MEQVKKFDNLGMPVRVAIYVLNGLLIIGFLVLCAFVILIGFWGSLYALGSLDRGGTAFLFVFFLILLWFLESFVCFTAVIVIAAAKQRWSWTLQFLPFVTAGIFYLIFILTNQVSAKTGTKIF